MLLLLWGITLLAVTTTALAFPEMGAGSFFSTTTLEEPTPPDLVGLFVPFNFSTPSSKTWCQPSSFSAFLWA